MRKEILDRRYVRTPEVIFLFMLSIVIGLVLQESACTGGKIRSLEERISILEQKVK